MTVMSDVNTTLATMKGISSSFQELAIKTTDEQTKRIFHQCMVDTDEMIQQLAVRVEKLKTEEPQYAEN